VVADRAKLAPRFVNACGHEVSDFVLVGIGGCDVGGNVRELDSSLDSPHMPALRVEKLKEQHDDR
jgi:hypothetical protein